MARYFLGREGRGDVEIAYDKGRGRLSCQITDWWKNLDTTGSPCGSPAEYSITKREGISQAERHLVEHTVESTLGLPKVAELKAKISEQIQSEVRWEVLQEETRTFSFTPPKCGRQTNAVYQLVREYYLVNERMRRFRRHDSWTTTVTEALPFFDVRPNIEPWIPECRCGGRPDPDFDGVLNLDLGPVSLQVGFLLRNGQVLLNFSDVGAAIPVPERHEITVSMPTSAVPSVVAWLGNLEDETLRGVLSAHSHGGWLQRVELEQVDEVLQLEIGPLVAATHYDVEL